MHIYTSPPLGQNPFGEALANRILHRFKLQGWEGLTQRVVSIAQRAESSRSDSGPEQFLTSLADAIREGKMLPNSPLLVNCAEEAPRIFACFAVDVEKPISEVLKTFRFIHDGMGGVGYSVTGGEPGCGELVRLIDRDTNENQEGRPRPASNAVTMPVSGELDAFLELAGTLTTTNMNVALADDFMASLQRDNESLHRLRRIAERIHATGQPGVVFNDRINRVARADTTAFAANVCGEAPLATDESALLASVNVAAFVITSPNGSRSFDTDSFKNCVALSVRFLDGMHDLHTHGNATIQVNSLATRKIGVGIMGFAHALMLLNISYGSDESLRFARSLSSTLHEAARNESRRLAAAHGTYPAWRPHHGEARRNASLTAIAGTATIALLVGTSQGIEPIHSHFLRQKVIDREVCVMDPVVSFLLGEQGVASHAAKARLAAGESLRQIAGDVIADLCPTALEIPGPTHVLMQGALQSCIDCGISKTVNCRADTTVSEIMDMLILAHSIGCLGLTVYRDGSLIDQPLQPSISDGSFCNI